jgi:hypothetical protein
LHSSCTVSVCDVVSREFLTWGGHNALELAVANGGHHGGFQGGWLRSKVYHLASASLVPRSSTRKVNTILYCESLMNRFWLEACGNEETDEVGNHQRNDDGIIPGCLEDHQHGRQVRIIPANNVPMPTNA